MPRWVLLTVALAAALGLAVFASQAPAPRPLHAPETAFSAARAMADVRVMAARPHPVGSPEHELVRAHLLGRMTALGLNPTTQAGPLSPGAVRRLDSWDTPTEGLLATNLIGVLPGTRPDLPAVLLMAHYDSVAGSPGAADDAAGVAAILEAVRALRARGPRLRDVVVLITDAEELGLDGARAFFGGHPLRDRIGAVINLEARGGGGRAMMFETGKGNAETIALFARAGRRADGGITSNALAVFVYEAMPNGSDFTVPRDRGVQGINLAFIGRPEQYHTPASTPDALDRGAVQHVGSQALETAGLLAAAVVLPRAGTDAVYADLFGRAVISHPPQMGWVLLIAALGLLGCAAWRARGHAGLRAADVGRGALDGVWLLSAGLVVTLFVRLLGGPLSGRSGGAEEYYALLARLPWLETGVALATLAVVLALLAGRTRPDRRVVAGAIAALTLVVQIMGGFDPAMLTVGAIAAGLSWMPALAARSAWGGWIGAVALVLALGAAAQTAAPQTAFLFLWPGLLAAGTAAAASLVDPGLTRPRALVPIAVAAVVGVGWLAALAHPVFLGIGMDLPGVLVGLALVMLAFLRPLSPERAAARPLLMAALAILVVGGGISVQGRIAEPVPAVAPG